MDTLDFATKIEERIAIGATMKRLPISGAFELLPVCNLNCRMCFIRKTMPECKKAGGIRPLSDWIRIAEELKEAGVLFLLLTGGEPFLYPDFETLYLKLRQMGFILTLNTNGTLIGEKEARYLAKDMPRRVNVTLYGACPETYKKVTGSAEAYEKTIHGIKCLLAEGIAVKMNVSLIPENVEELEAFHRIAGELGIPLEVNAYMYPATREGECSFPESSRLTPERAGEADLLNNKLRFEPEMYEEYLQSAAKVYQELDIETEEKEEKEQEQLPCRAGRSSFWINWKYQLSSCVFLEEGKVSLDDSTFSKGWEKITAVREEHRLPKACASCKMRHFCLVCGAACLHETGRMDGKPEYLCQMTREKLRLAYEMVKNS